MSEALELLRDLSEASGASGHESAVRETMIRHFPPEIEVDNDNLGSVIACLAGMSDEPRVMLAAHMDEVGFMVTRVTENGFLRFQPIGGWWDQVLLAQRVEVLGAEGPVPGVIGSKPPHLLDTKARQRVMEKKDMFIDVGARDSDHVRQMGLRPGDPVVPWSPFRIMKDENLLMGKAWDDRVGCAAVVQTLKELAHRPHPNTVYGVGTVQEEVGMRGAITSAEVVKPDVCLILESSIASDVPGADSDSAADSLGGGPSLVLYDASMIPSTRLRDLVMETAEDLGINLQFTFASRGGTDGGRIHMFSRGVPSLVLGVPARYIHSHTGIIDLRDFDSLVRLLVGVVERIDIQVSKDLCGF